jgi:hypothetical protein
MRFAGSVFDLPAFPQADDADEEPDSPAAERESLRIYAGGDIRQGFAEIYRMLKKGEYHYGRKEPVHIAKMNRYKRLLNRHDIVFEETLKKIV